MKQCLVHVTDHRIAEGVWRSKPEISVQVRNMSLTSFLSTIMRRMHAHDTAPIAAADTTYASTVPVTCTTYPITALSVTCDRKYAASNDAMSVATPRTSADVSPLTSQKNI